MGSLVHVLYALCQVMKGYMLLILLHFFKFPLLPSLESGSGYISTGRAFDPTSAK